MFMVPVINKSVMVLCVIANCPCDMAAETAKYGKGLWLIAALSSDDSKKEVQEQIGPPTVDLGTTFSLGYDIEHGFYGGWRSVHRYDNYNAVIVYENGKVSGVGFKPFWPFLGNSFDEWAWQEIETTSKISPQ
jgi:hypothetical protein